MTPLWPDDPDPPPPSRRRWWARCDDCGRKVWAVGSLRRDPDGHRRGEKCRRAWARAHRRLCVPRTIPVRPAGHVPGQLEINEGEADA